MSNPSLPLTIQTPMVSNLGAKIVIDNNYLSLPYSVNNAYWFVIIDRKTLKVVVNVHTSDNQNVPSEVQPYVGNTDYILILTTSLINSANIPTGNLYKYLIQEGASTELKRMEQIYATLNCGNWGWFAYTFVGIMDNSGTPGYELFNYVNSTVMTMQLIPITTPSGIIYTVAPIR